MNAAKTDAKAVLDVVLPFAHQMLRDYREFLPFGGRMAPDGTIAHVGATTGREHSPSKELIQIMRDAFQREAQSGLLRTSAIVYDIRTVPPGHSEKQDAIAASIDHVSGYSAVIIYPYAFAPGGELNVESPFAVEGDYAIFGHRQK
jgi:hypothetical protein